MVATPVGTSARLAMTVGEHTLPSRSSQVPTQVELPETVVLPQRGLFDWRLRELWHYRDLTAMFVWRDFVSVYKQTVLGPLWHLIKPLITTAIFTVIFSRLAGLSTDGAPPFLFYMVGNVVWTYFSSCLDNIAKTLVGNAHILGKVYFHRLVIPVSLVLSNLIAFGIQLAILIAAMIVYSLLGQTVHISAWILAVPVLLLILAGFALGFGLVICAATTRYRDLTHLLTFGLQLLMYLTPVIYPISEVPDRYRWVAQLNPLAVVFEGFRRGLLGVGAVSLEQLAISVGCMLLVLIFGLMAFTRAERTFLDTI
jgi:lipopolysaccharide transport system permease protein